MASNSQAGFKPQWTCSYSRPRTPAQASRAYNHLRTVAYLLDTSSSLVPGLDQLPFEFGIEPVVGAAIPVVGDVAGVVVGLYFVLVAWWCFELGWRTVGLMVLNLVLDGVVGIVPVIGDILDFIFKANIHNLALLESDLRRGKWAPIVVASRGGKGTDGPVRLGRGEKVKVDLGNFFKRNSSK